MLELIILGDIVGQAALTEACKFVQTESKNDKNSHKQVFICNAENAAQGYGITKLNYDQLTQAGFHMITSGNHIWDKSETKHYINHASKLIRPANYPGNHLGDGYKIFNVNYKSKNISIAVINLLGRALMKDLVDCPFQKFQEIYTVLHKEKKADIILVDFHAELTSEKNAFGLYTDGKATATWGTHTHIPTSDLKLLPQQTFYVTDLGGCIAEHSVLGYDATQVINRFLTSAKDKIQISKNKIILNGIKLIINPDDNFNIVSFARL